MFRICGFNALFWVSRPQRSRIGLSMPLLSARAAQSQSGATAMADEDAVDMPAGVAGKRTTNSPCVWLANAESGNQGSHRCRSCNCAVPLPDGGSCGCELEADLRRQPRLGCRAVRDARQLAAPRRPVRGGVGLVPRHVAPRSGEGSSGSRLRRLSTAAVPDLPPLARARSALRLSSTARPGVGLEQTALSSLA
jgi:hypothetical protein